MPVRLYHVLSSFATLGLSCLLSSLIVCTLGRVIGFGDSLALALVTCSALTLLLGGAALAWEAGLYIRPAKDVMVAAAKVASGDFRVRIPLPSWRIGLKEGYSLIENFNRMARELEGMERMQKDFIANVSHEFKTPLSSIIGFTEILMEGGADDGERQEYLALVHDEARRLSRLSESLLLLSRLDAQHIVTSRPVVVDEQIRRCLILLTEKCSYKGLSLDIFLEPMTIESDADLLEHVWLNLIDNALKYSPCGKTLHISGRMLPDSVSVRIRDEGPGIPVEKQQHIWTRFYQCEESHKEQGHGLGLSIVQRVVDILGGRVECTSGTGRGTEMHVVLPKKIIVSTAP
ncbi:MAG: HAMP domain-containing histidine kinase [Desulfovibrio sp.]|nr:HAMP domain-containing histidine kinase [Desulfovibrio sp.]